MAKKKKPTVEEEVKTDAVTPEPEEQYDVPAEEEVTGSGDEPEYEDEDPEAVNADARQSAASSNSRLKEMMNQNFIEYASYVIKDRAIPDVDDGFKPVQRRILWAMNMVDDGSFHKVAGVIGDTMKFHPHGDASIGGALVYLANKELFIEKQGNYGSIITGKPAAAPRYIECRLTKLAKDVLFNRDITEVVDSYDGRNVEPVVLPSKLPTLLIMGADGIAVGTNTRIMPHNFTEVLQAQIALLKGEPFVLYPDFIQGGIMDVSKYEDGKGKLTVRAKLDIEKRDIVIREIPAMTDTERLMTSVDNAIKKNKIKIATLHDYTAKDVDIHLVPIRGYAPEKALNALYAYTDCQLSISCNPMVIMDNRPCCLSITEILKRNTEKLIRYLTWELHIESGKCLEKILARTLAQIFIEEGIYKRIEKCKSREAMFKEVRTGLEKFRSEWQPLVQALHENILNQPHIIPIDKEMQERLDQMAAGIVPDSEIAKLVEIPIRRISAFEVDENREQIALLQKTLDTAQKNLKRIKQYAIKFLQGLIDKYGAMFPRRTEICTDGFEKIDMRKVALNNIRVGWDKKNCYIGTNVKSDDSIMCSEIDHLLCIERTGEYKIINIPEKIYIDRLYEFRKYDKTTEFGIVYSEKKTGKVYMKRTVIDKFITDKEYRIIPDGCRLEMITPRAGAIYEIRVDTPIKSRQVQEINLMDAPLRSPKAGGTPISLRKLQKITFVRYLDESDAAAENDPGLFAPGEVETAGPVEETPVTDGPQETAEPETAGPVEETPAVKPEKTVKPRTKKEKKAKVVDPEPVMEESSDDADAGTPPPPAETAEGGEEDETWGIQPDLGF